jgi:hypothetical protein
MKSENPVRDKSYMFDSLSSDCNELLKLLGSITKSMKDKLDSTK